MTTRLKTVDPAKATGKAKEFLDEAHSKFGMTPNMTKMMANSPAVLRAFLDFYATLGTGSLDAKVREQIALSVSESNQCEYCLSAHSAIGKMVGLGEKDIVGARRTKVSDPKVEAGLVFAQQVAERQGKVSNEEISRVRQTGYTDGEIAEIVANVALTIFTNYINNVAQTDVDFPKVTPGRY